MWNIENEEIDVMTLRKFKIHEQLITMPFLKLDLKGSSALLFSFLESSPSHENKPRFSSQLMRWITDDHWNWCSHCLQMCEEGQTMFCDSAPISRTTQSTCRLMKSNKFFSFLLFFFLIYFLFYDVFLLFIYLTFFFVLLLIYLYCYLFNLSLNII